MVKITNLKKISKMEEYPFCGSTTEQRISFTLIPDGICLGKKCGKMAQVFHHLSPKFEILIPFCHVCHFTYQNDIVAVIELIKELVVD